MPRLFRSIAFDYFEQFKVFPLTLYPVENHHPIDQHGHGGFFELAIITRGNALHHSKAGSEPISKGDVLSIPGGLSHGYSQCERLSLINVLFDPHEMASPPQWQGEIPGYDSVFPYSDVPSTAARFVSRVRLGEHSLARVIGLSARIHDEVVHQRAGHRAAAKGLFCALAAELCRHEGTSVSPVSEAMLRLTDLLGWLNRNYAGRISTATMAERAHMSKSTLERHFRAAFNKSPQEFLIELRLRQAALLLHYSDVAIAEVGAKVGVDDPSYFARLFRRHHGISPGEFRKRIHERASVGENPRT